MKSGTRSPFRRQFVAGLAAVIGIGLAAPAAWAADMAKNSAATLARDGQGALNAAVRERSRRQEHRRQGQGDPGLSRR